jgi:predicted Ser/Thr protein kinase
MVYIPIQEFTISKSSLKIEIEIINYTINSNAVARVNFLDAEDKAISSVIVYIDGEEFNTQWNTDEDLVNIVLAKLGLTRAP